MEKNCAFRMKPIHQEKREKHGYIDYVQLRIQLNLKLMN